MNKKLLTLSIFIWILVFNFGCSSRTLIVSQDIVYERSSWEELEDFDDEDFRNVKLAFSRSCLKLANDPLWGQICSDLVVLPDEEKFIRQFFLNNFQPFLLVNKDDDNEGLITGYYQPLLHGSYTKKEPYTHPLYKLPPQCPQDKESLMDKDELPCFSRAEIESELDPLIGNELLWVDNKTDSFFLHIQGSGLVQMDTGELLSIGYAGKNHQKYVPIGRVLVEKEELDMDEVSMQSIRKWLDENPHRQDEIFHENPSYVFFRTLDSIDPFGSLGVPVTPKRSIAVDPRYVPMGYPVYMVTENHEGDDINRLFFAQDTGGAIKGRVRADIYFGFGKEAEYLAGHMKGDGRIWVFLPKSLKTVQLSNIKEDY